MERCESPSEFSAGQRANVLNVKSFFRYRSVRLCHVTSVVAVAVRVGNFALKSCPNTPNYATIHELF